MIFADKINPFTTPASVSRSIFVLCYDIAEPRRLQRVHRCCASLGIPLQYSVFLLPTADSAEEARDALCRIIDDDEDDLRCYRAKSLSQAHMRGEAFMPSSVIISDCSIRNDDR